MTAATAQLPQAWSALLDDKREMYVTLAAAGYQGSRALFAQHGLPRARSAMHPSRQRGGQRSPRCWISATLSAIIGGSLPGRRSH